MINRFNSKTKAVTFTILSMAMGFLLMFGVFKGVDYIKINNSREVNTASVINGAKPLDSKPKYFYVTKTSKASLKDLKISADAYIVGDLDTGEIIMSKNQDKKMPLASVSKLMTALVTKKIAKDADVAKASKNALATYGENGNFKLGEKIKVNELLYPLLMESSNDAAEILAEHFDRDSFISKMNLEANRLKMSGTSFKDPSGLSSDNVSTAADMFKLVGYLKDQIPEVLKITQQKSYKNKAHTWYSTNQFLSDMSYIGGKSGYTDPAKQTVISTFALPLGQVGTRPIAITLLRSTDRYKDVQSILNYLKKNIYYGGAADAKANWIEEKLNVPDIRDPDFITLAFLGDIMLDRGVQSSVNKNFGGDYSSLFEKMGVLKKSDIVFANLEGPASDKGTDGKNLYSFRMDPSVVPALKGAGISILSVANNHVGDWGRAAYIDTLLRLTENEILYTGGGTKDEAENPTIIEKYGMKIGFLGFSDVGPNHMAVTDDKIGLLLANNPRFDEIIKNASEQVDYLIVSFHWGDEYKTKHNARQEELAHRAVDNGARVIIGHHPHVAEDTEVYKNGFIAYSLGNFIFDQKFSTNTMQGMMLELKLGRDGGMTTKKDTIKLNSVFQPDKIIFGKEEKVKFQTPKPAR